VKLEHAKRVMAQNISGGMKRRLEFAISLVHNPKILILDEPFTGLDINIRDELWSEIQDVKKSGVTVIISTHLLSSAQENVDRVIVLNNRKIVENFLLSEKSSTFNLEKNFVEAVK